MKKLGLMVLAALMGAGAWAETETVDGVTWSYTVGGGVIDVFGEVTVVSNASATVTGATPCVGEMVMPARLGGYPVRTVGSSAFEWKNEISKMTLPSGLTRIESSAFRSCSALTEINIPDGVTYLGAYAFYSCSSLRQIELPDSVTSMDSSGCQFEYCSALVSVRFPANLTAIPGGCFYGCTKLKAINLPSRVTSIGSSAFSGCSAATTLTLPESVTSIGASAFYGCRALTSLAIPSQAVVGDGAFVDCCNLEVITVAAGNPSVKIVDGCLVSLAGTELYAAPSGNAEVTIPEGVVTIPRYMFQYADNLKSIHLPSTLLSIGGHAFEWCSSLVSIEFPASLASFSGSMTFDGCNSLKSVIFNGPPPANVNNQYLISSSRQISYPRESGAEWQRIVGLSNFNGFTQSNKPQVEYVNVAVRASDQTILDVAYRVTSTKPTVKVRALAFQDGERSFAKVVRPTDFIEGTAANLGDKITTGVEHKLSWRVSSDWKIDLAKVKFEILAVEDDLLPLELVTIPKNGTNKAMEISWNAITEAQVFDALLWLYADGDKGLVLSDGILMRQTDNYVLAGGTTLSIWSGRYKKDLTGTSTYYYFTNAPEYVFGKMGYSVLSSENLSYANEMTRLGLSPDGVRQYVCRVLGD